MLVLLLTAAIAILALVFGVIFVYVFKYRAGSGIDREDASTSVDDFLRPHANPIDPRRTPRACEAPL